MQFIVKTVASSILGSVGWWLGDFVGMGTPIMVSLVLSIVG